jgi:GNAT superfamily N-acetyltransferase
MELPIARQSYEPSSEALVRAVKRAEVILARAVAEELVLDGATVFTNPGRAGFQGCNWAGDLRVEPGESGEGLMGEVEGVFEKAGTRCGLLQYSEQVWPEGLSRVIESRGFRASNRTIGLLRGYRRSRVMDGRVQIVPARAVYPRLGGFYERMALDDDYAGNGSPAEFAGAMIDRLDETRYEVFIGRVGGEAVGMAGVLTVGSMGVLRDIYALPSCRGTGIGAALVGHVIGHCERSRFEQVVLELARGCRSQRFYESLGFVEAAWYTRYQRVG